MPLLPTYPQGAGSIQEMNRLIILGNGFDLAHGLKTSYSDFILDYFQKSLDKFEHDDDLMKLEVGVNANELKGIQSLKRLLFLLNDYKKYITIAYSNKFLETLMTRAALTNWVDIENIYYSLLRKHIPTTGKEELLDEEAVKTLNDELEQIRELLKTYLIDSSKPDVGGWRLLIADFKSIFDQEFNKNEIHADLHPTCKKPANTYFLNFNYTATIKYHFQETDERPDVINIHGQLNDDKNPMVFGFGDELDDAYARIERLNQNELFRHIKSFAYFQTPNYQRLLRVVDSGPFQVYIIGHSCGLSDRTMLNYIFESDNCKSIKIFHHKDKGHFVTTTQEISRHFRDKASMRSKIVPFDKQNRCPQITDDF
ncbi:MAG: AbiH family protein [Imperialibacter sp.]|uniref:AbiH family protein n=1 Tax=Imperialibacter sp. TaxID=2038411 RepID=UPI0032EB7969